MPTDEPTTPRTAARQGIAPTTNRLTEQLLTLITDYEQERRAAIIAAGGDPDEDRDPLEYVRWIADTYTRHRDDERHLDELADQLTLDDARALRVAGDAVKAITPRLIMLEHAGGKDAPQIADELGLTESYVYRIIRQHRDQKAAAEQ